MLYEVLTLIVCYVSAIVTQIVTSLASEDILRYFMRGNPWTVTVFVIHSGKSPFVYFFLSRKLQRYSKKLLRKATHLIRCSNYTYENSTFKCNFVASTKFVSSKFVFRLKLKIRTKSFSSN